MLVCVTGLTGNGKTTVMKIIKQEGFNIFIMDDYLRFLRLCVNIAVILTIRSNVIYGIYRHIDAQV